MSIKIAILSDFHFGYAYNTELESDSFANADEAMGKALDSDLILIAGDVFDSRLPKTEVWARAIKILVRPLLKGSSGVKLVSCTKELKAAAKRTLQHLPVVALHGTHERRYGINAIEALEQAGILIHLHCQTAVFEKDGVRVAVHGMSGVPERYAAKALKEWNPKPLPDCVNVLMLHQSIDPYVYSPLEPLSLKLPDLPKGFDLIIDGHIHESGQERIGGPDGTLLIMPGSTIVTQLEPAEAGIEKGFYEIEISGESGKKIEVNFIPLKNNRKFFYKEIKAEGSLRERVESELNGILSKGLAKPPLVKLKIFGKETEVVGQELREIERRYAGKAIIGFAKELESPEIVKKIEFLRNLREQKLSVEEIGLELLRKNLEELTFAATFDHESMFGLLSDGNVERAFNILTGEQKTLTQFSKFSKLTNKSGE